MTKKPTRVAGPLLIASATLCFLAGSIPASHLPQEAGVGSRRLWDSTYIDKKGVVHPKGNRRYRVVTPKVPTTGVAGDSVVGVTIWRLKDSKPEENGARLLLHTETGGSELVPVRAEADSRFAVGERVRLSIEAASKGFLYVIDCEQYADGKLGDPYLVFPTLRTRMGNNEVFPGRVIEIPDQGDRPPCFTLEPGRSDEVAEVLTIIVSPAPLKDVAIGRDPLKLNGADVTRWENEWGAAPGRLELEGGAGRGWTNEEKDAGADGGRLLKQEDARPQTLYYNPRAKPGMPVLVKLELIYRKEKAPGPPG
jgi:hypothetical protein